MFTFRKKTHMPLSGQALPGSGPNRSALVLAVALVLALLPMLVPSPAAAQCGDWSKVTAVTGRITFSYSHTEVSFDGRTRQKMEHSAEVFADLRRINVGLFRGLLTGGTASMNDAVTFIGTNPSTLRGNGISGGGMILHIDSPAGCRYSFGSSTQIDAVLTSSDGRIEHRSGFPLASLSSDFRPISDPPSTLSGSASFPTNASGDSYVPGGAGGNGGAAMVSWSFTQVDDTLDDTCKEPGASTVSCENQTLSEAVGIVGTPFTLHYHSDRAPGRAAANSLAISHQRHLGGWSVDIHHLYDANQNALYLGNGERRDAVALGTVNRQSDGGFLIGSEDAIEIYVFDPSGRHLRTRDALTGASLYEFAYDSQERLTSITDADENITTIERDANGHPVAIVSAFGLRTALTVDANGYLASIANPAGQSVALSSTPEGLLTQLTDPNNHVSNFTYDDNGRLTHDKDAAGGFQELSRTSHPDRSYTVRRTTGEGRITDYQVTLRPGGGEDRLITHPTGLQANVTRTSAAAQSVKSPDGMESSLALGADPRFGRSAPIVQSASTKTPSGLNFVSSATRAATLTDPADPFSLATLTETLNLNGRTYTDAYDGATKTFTHITPAGRQGITLIDAKGRVVQEQTTGLFPLSYTYDTRGRLASITQGAGPDARTVNFNYNPSGYLQTVTDPLNRTVNYEYDAAGRVTRQALPDGREVLYGYDAKSNLISLTPPGRPAHVFAYTPVDQTAKYIPPAVAGTGSTLYTYDLDKQLTRISRPDGQVLDFGYDSAGRLSTLTIPTGVLSYTYDSTTGKLTTITAPDGGTLGSSYSGALLTQTAWTGTIMGSVGRTYDNNFRMTSLTVNGADPVAFSYDADSLLATAGALTLNRNAQNGLLTGTALDSITDTLTYSGFGEVADYSAKLNATEIFGTQYSHDKLGRITQKVERLGVVTNTFDYGYDLAGRLTEVKQNGVVTASYTYDGNGNRLSGPGLLTAPSYDDQDRLIHYGGNDYTYTANGELASKTTGAFITIYQYDVLGNLKSVTLPGGTVIDYIIDGNNRRIGKRVNRTLVQGLLYQDESRPHGGQNISIAGLQDLTLFSPTFLSEIKSTEH